MPYCFCFSCQSLEALDNFLKMNSFKIVATSEENGVNYITIPCNWEHGKYYIKCLKTTNVSFEMNNRFVNSLFNTERL